MGSSCTFWVYLEITEVKGIPFSVYLRACTLLSPRVESNQRVNNAPIPVMTKMQQMTEENCQYLPVLGMEQCASKAGVVTVIDILHAMTGRKGKERYVGRWRSISVKGVE